MRALLDRSKAVPSVNVMPTRPSAPVETYIAEINRITDLGLAGLSAERRLNDHGVDMLDRDRTCRRNDFSDWLYRSILDGRLSLERSASVPGRQENSRSDKTAPVTKTAVACTRIVLPSGRVSPIKIGSSYCRAAAIRPQRIARIRFIFVFSAATAGYFNFCVRGPCGSKNRRKTLKINH